MAASVSSSNLASSPRDKSQPASSTNTRWKTAVVAIAIIAGLAALACLTAGVVPGMLAAGAIGAKLACIGGGLLFSGVLLVSVSIARCSTH